MSGSVYRVSDLVPGGGGERGFSDRALVSGTHQSSTLPFCCPVVLFSCCLVVPLSRCPVVPLSVGSTSSKSPDSTSSSPESARVSP